MNNITSYNEYVSEGLLSSVTSFLKAQYNNIFKDPNQALNNLFNDYVKRVDKEKNTANLYQKYLKNSQTIVQNEINKSESIDSVNKIITDNVKYFYFALKPIVNKLQNKEFTVETIFERSKDKRLQKLMSYPEDQFSNAVQQYINEGVLPWIKKDSGLDKQENQQTQEPNQQNQAPSTTERVRYDISRILEADDPNASNQEDLVKYKQSAIKWINMSLFDLLKSKMQLLNQLGASSSNNIDDVSKQMKGTNNENAKKMILNKIVGLDKLGLENLANYLQIKKEELGQL